MSTVKPTLALLLLALPASAADLEQLQRSLLSHGFTIEEQQPPGKTYGRFIPAQKRLQISPLVRELGITRAVLLHEAVHAAQSCPDGALSLIGVQRRVDPVIGSRIRYILHSQYKPHAAALEREAFVIQSQPDAEQLIITALNQRCSR